MSELKPCPVFPKHPCLNCPKHPCALDTKNRCEIFGQHNEAEDCPLRQPCPDCAAKDKEISIAYNSISMMCDQFLSIRGLCRDYDNNLDDARFKKIHYYCILTASDIKQHVDIFAQIEALKNDCAAKDAEIIRLKGLGDVNCSETRKRLDRDIEAKKEKAKS